jgi:hypothetical protein
VKISYGDRLRETFCCCFRENYWMRKAKLTQVQGNRRIEKTLGFADLMRDILILKAFLKEVTTKQ